MSKFLLLLGPSGVGKSTIIRKLRHLTEKFVYISPYMTRPLRPGETDKVPVCDTQMDELMVAGELVAVNTLFGGIRYGTPRAPIIDALRVGNYPVLDWPVQHLEIMQSAFPDRLFVVYVSPPSLEILQERISRDGRDTDGSRFRAAQSELKRFWKSYYSDMLNLEVTSEDDNTDDLAQSILDDYLKSF